MKYALAIVLYNIYLLAIKNSDPLKIYNLVKSNGPTKSKL